MILLTLLSSSMAGTIGYANGGALPEDPALLNPVTHRLTVVGTYGGAGPSAQASGNQVFLINGDRGTYTATTSTTGTFAVSAHVGPNPPGARFPAWWPYGAQFVRSDRVLLPLLFEAVHRPSYQVFDRDRVVLYDERFGLDSAASPGSRSDALTFQITPYGLDELARIHRLGMPYPGYASFQDDLDHEVQFIDPQVADAGWCTPITLNSPFVSTSYAAGVYATALAEYGIYRAALTSNPLAAQAMCVQSAPTVADFDVCVGRIDVSADALTVADLEDVQFDVEPSSDLLLADVHLAQPHLDATAELRELSIRYNTQRLCLGRPEVSIPDNAISGLSNIDDWATCDLDFDAEAGLIDELYYDLSGGPSIEVSRSVGAAPATLVDTSSQVLDTCSEGWLVGSVRPLVEAYGTSVSAALSFAWDRFTPRTDSADALTELFADFSVHDVALDGVELTTSFDAPAVPPMGGMRLTASSAFAPINPTEAAAQRATMALAPPRDPDWRDDGKTPTNVPFDISVDVSAAYINQALRAGAARRLSTLPVLPHAGELGLPGRQPVPLTQSNVEQWLGLALPELAGVELGITIRRTIDPFTFMLADLPNPPPPGRWPLTLQIGQVLVTVSETSGPNPGRVWLSGVYDLHESDLGIHLPEPGEDTFHVVRRDTSWFFTVLQSELSSCARSPHVGLPQFVGTCERTIESKIGTLVHNRITTQLDDILADLPAPLVFNANGSSSRTRKLQEVQRFQDGNRVTIYADLVP